MKKSFSVMVAILLIASMSVLAFAACETECEHKNRQHFEAVEATCAKDGNVEYWYCPDCGEYLDSYNSVLTQEELVVKATGEHEFVDGVCSVCGANEAPGEGLIFQLNNDEASYFVRGIGSATSKDIVIPATHNGLPVTSIEQRAFSNCSGLTSVTIGDSVTSIGYSAFSGCSGLTNVTIGNSVTSIGSSAFSGCSGLTSIVIPDSVTSVGERAFYGCNGLTSVTIKEGVTSIGEDAFYGCSGLTSITIPDSVTRIGDSVFWECNGLTSITIPFVGERADGTGVTALRHIFGPYQNSTIPESLKEVIVTGGTSIGGFAGCSGLTSITIPDSVTSIRDGAFARCSGLTSITIPDSVTSIGEDAFSGCSGLTSVTIGEGVTSIDNWAFRGCSGLTSVTIGNSVTSIGGRAFSGCSGLTSVVIPDNVTSIGEGAFA